MIELQPLPCKPVCDEKFHAHGVHLHPTFTAPPVESTFEIGSEVVEIFCGSSQPFGAPSLMFDRILTATLSGDKISTTGVKQEYLEFALPPNSLDSHQTQKQDEISE